MVSRSGVRVLIFLQKEMRVGIAQTLFEREYLDVLRPRSCFELSCCAPTADPERSVEEPKEINTFA